MLLFGLTLLSAGEQCHIIFNSWPFSKYLVTDRIVFCKEQLFGEISRPFPGRSIFYVVYLSLIR